MKHIYLNLKRFDIPTETGGVNRIASPAEWGPYIVSHTQDQLAAYNPKDVEFAMFFPEAHLIGAVSARKADSALKIGHRVFWDRIQPLAATSVHLLQSYR